MSNGLVFLSFVTGLMFPVYFLFSIYYIKNKPIYMLINFIAIIASLVIGILYLRGALEFSFDVKVLLSLTGVIFAPALLMSIYTKYNVLVKSFENRRKYYLYPVLVVVLVVVLINVLGYVD